MKRFDPERLNHLNRECNGEPVYFVGMGAYDFQLSFANIDRIQTKVKAVFSIRGNQYFWAEGPADTPIGLLVNQIPVKFELPTPFALRMNFASGDFVEFYTDEDPYEAVIIDFGTREDARMMEIY